MAKHIITDDERGHRPPLSEDHDSEVISLRVIKPVWEWWQRLKPEQRRSLIYYAYENLPKTE